MTQVEKLSIALTAELAEQVREAVRSGEYASASEVIREALRGWLGNRRSADELRRLVAEGLASGAPQERQSLQTFLASARARRAKTRAA